MASKPNWLAQPITFCGSLGSPIMPQARHNVNFRFAVRASAAGTARVTKPPKLARDVVLTKCLRFTAATMAFTGFGGKRRGVIFAAVEKPRDSTRPRRNQRDLECGDLSPLSQVW